MTNLLEAPPLFSDYTLSQLKSVKHELKEDIRLAGKGRLLILKPVFERNLRRVSRLLKQRSLKTEEV